MQSLLFGDVTLGYIFSIATAQMVGLGNRQSTSTTTSIIWATFVCVTSIRANGIILSIKEDQWRLVKQNYVCIKNKRSGENGDDTNYTTCRLAHRYADIPLRYFWVCFDRKTNFFPFQDSDVSHYYAL